MYKLIIVDCYEQQIYKEITDNIVFKSKKQAIWFLYNDSRINYYYNYEVNKIA